MSEYTGPVVFSEGEHFPVGDDGHPDTSRPLRWVDGDTYRDAEAGEPLHNDVHMVKAVDIDPRQYEVHAGGLASYPVGAHVVSEDAVTYFLANPDGSHVDDVPLRWDAATESFVQEGVA
jgi:hypothetical protein